MFRRTDSGSRVGALVCLFVLALITAIIAVPYQFKSSAAAGSDTPRNGNDVGGLVRRTVSEDEGIPKMWDIREEKGEQAAEALRYFRQRTGKDAAVVADIRSDFARGEEELKARIPHAKVEYNLDIRTPEVITPDVWAPRIEFLTQPTSKNRAEALRDFIRQNQSLVGLDSARIDELKVAADYTNPDGNISYAHLEQEIYGVPVFRGEVKAGFTRDGRIIRVINNLAPGVDYSAISSDFGNPDLAVMKAAQHIRHQPEGGRFVRNSAESSDLKVVYGSGDWATTAEKMYFPTEPGVIVPAWRVLIWQPVNAYYVIVDAEKQTVLWHKNITDDQTQTATYQVYRNTNAYINVADHAAPLSPGPMNPGLGTQGPLLTRNNVTLIGNEGPFSANNLGWITDGQNITDGNFNEAGVDRVAPNGVDAPQAGDTGCPGAGCRVFTSTWNPPPGSPAPGDAPLTAQAQRGAVIQMFYIMNWYQSELYARGFTEAARNFQNDNFGRGGVANDRVSSEGQDSSGTNNANFATPADGGRGRMQMYIWTGPDPDRDGTPDADIVIHEVSHGLSNRLHGNGSGLGNQGGMMGEGWGDWYAHTMLAEPTDDPMGVYSVGGYSLFNLSAGFTANFYYGIRRFPTAIMASTGGPNNRPHNPLTFGHINTGCDTTLGTTTTAVSSAYPRSPVIATSGNCSQVHNAGEIWKSALWEVRHLFIQRKGFTVGTRDVLQVVTDGMKLAPLNPNMLQERDAIIAAAQALSLSPETAADALDVREGFRIRGMGFSASVQSSTAVTEAFDSPQVSSGGPPVVTSGNAIIEPNECNTLNIPLSNNSGQAATGITAVLSTTTPGVTISQPNSAYPDIPGGGGPVNNSTPFQISTDNTVACFTNIALTLTVTYSGGGGGSPATFNYSVPVGVAGNNYTFANAAGTIPPGGTLVAGSQADDFAATITLPTGWTSSIYGTAVTSLSASTNGLLQVNGTAPTAFTNTALPGTAAPTGPRLFPFWDDLIMTTARTGANGGIYTETYGTAPNRTFKIEWRAQHFSNVAADGVTINFAIILNEGSSAFSYVYALTGSGGTTVNANGASATVGVQFTNSGTQFTQYSFDQAIITPGLQLNATLPAGVCSPGSGGCGVGPSPTPTPSPSPSPTPTPSPSPSPSVSPTPSASPTPSPSPSCTPLAQGFDDVTTLPGGGWNLQNLSSPIGTQATWFQGNSAVFPSQTGAPNSYIAANFNNTAGTGTISNWLLTPVVTLTNGQTMSFWTRTVTTPGFADRLQVRMSTAGASTNVGSSATSVGDFTTLLLDINPTYILTGAGSYPNVWTQYTVTVSGLGGPTTGRFAFRYFVENGGPTGANSDYIGIDTVEIGCPTGPSPTPSPSPSASPTPSPSPSPGNSTKWIPDTPFPFAIPDNVPAGVNIPITVSGLTGNLTEVRLQNLTWNPIHTWGGDIIIRLTAPGGSPTATITQRRGQTTCGTGAGSSGDYTGPYTFGDAFGASPNFHTLAATGTTPVPPGNYQATRCATTAGEIVLLNPIFAGPVRPGPGDDAAADTLEVFNGMSAEAANGTWILNVSDNAAADTGSISLFQLGLTTDTGGPTPSPTPTPSPSPSPSPSATPTPSPSPSPGTCTFSNGGLNPQPLTKSGVAAPAGSFWSEVQNNTGNTAEANTSAGFSGGVTTTTTFRLADDFTISTTCQLISVDTYAYQTGGPTTSPFTAATLRIWNGPPNAGGTVIFGDTTTNRLIGSVDTGFFRIFNTVAPAPGTAPGTTRRIWRNTLSINTTLPPGTYWLDWNTTITALGAHFAPSKTIEGSRGAPTDNALQFSSATSTWTAVIDTGNPASAPDFPQDFPFDVVGTPVGGPSPTPTPSPSPSPTPSPSPSPSPSPTPTPSPSPTPGPCDQRFDTVTAPALPAGWTAVTTTGALAPWVTTTNNPDTPSNAAFAGSVPTVSNTELVSPPFIVASGGSQMTFRNAFNLEAGTAPAGFDGMVLEISINGGPYVDIITAGGSWVTGGYNRTISTAFGSPIAGRQAWSGLSGGTNTAPAYITTTVNLPATANGQLVRMKWRVATDSSAVATGTPGAWVDTISGIACVPTSAGVDVSGRVLTSDGRGLRNATVTMTDANGVVRTATTSSFGFYRFEGVTVGESYVMGVSSRNYRFTPRVVQVFDSMTDIDFIGLE